MADSMDRVRSRRGAWLRFWLGPIVAFGIALIAPLVAGVTSSPVWFRLVLPFLGAGFCWMLVLFLLGALEERRLRLAKARFADAVVEPALRARRSVTALWMLRPLGFTVAERAPRRWLLVLTDDAVELWGGPIRRLVRYARLPLVSIVDVQLDRILDRRQFSYCVRLSVGTGGAPWSVPLLVLGGSPFGLGTAELEELSGLCGAIDAARAAHLELPAPPTPRE